MFIPAGHQTYVKYDIYNPQNKGDWDDKTYMGSVEASSQEAIERLSSSIYMSKEGEIFYELIDLKEVVVDGCSYQVTDGRCSKAVAIEKIKEILKDHFKII
jgi:hypothetical protein